MKLLSDWGFSLKSLRDGSRGEYWVAAQGLLLGGLLFLPVYSPVSQLPLGVAYACWGIGGAVLAFAAVLIGKGVLDLGQSLTPLPYPREDGQLVQTGMYGIVRHPLYSGLILGTLGWAIAQVSLTHVAAALLFLLFFDAKAAREEAWLQEKYPDYADYQQQVKKLLPWVY